MCADWNKSYDESFNEASNSNILCEYALGEPANVNGIKEESLSDSLSSDGINEETLSELSSVHSLKEKSHYNPFTFYGMNEQTLSELSNVNDIKDEPFSDPLRRRMNEETPSEPLTFFNDDTLNKAYTSAGIKRRKLNKLDFKSHFNYRRDFQKTFGDRAKCIRYAEERGLVLKTKICHIHKKPMYVQPNKGVFGYFTCLSKSCQNRAKCYSQATGTLFENSKISLTKIFVLMFGFAHNFSLDLIRSEAMDSEDDTCLSKETLTDWLVFFKEAVKVSIQIDQQLIGLIGGPGKVVQVHRSVFGKRENTEGKIEGQWILAMIEDQSEDIRIELYPNHNFSEDVLIPLIKKHIQLGSTIHTNGLNEYKCLSQHGFIHNSVNQSDPKNPYVGPEEVNTQRIMSHIAYLKKMYHLKYNPQTYNLENFIYEHRWRRQCRIENKDLFLDLIECVRKAFPPGKSK